MKNIFRFAMAAGGICLAMCTFGCSKKAKVTTVVPKNPGLILPKSATARDDFIRGVDVSTVIALEKSGVVFRDFDGKEEDLFKILRDNGVNYIRVRVWVNPFDDNGNSFGGGGNDLQTAIEIGKRAAKYDLPLLVDFHYSDFWADPQKQKAPRAWENMSVEQKCDAIYDYTKKSLKELRGKGAIVGMVQVGNETTTGMCGEKNWMHVCKMMNAGAKAIREISKDIKIVLHFTNPEKDGEYLHIAQILDHNKVDYDVFASSDYPFWHLSTKNLAKVLSEVSEATGKEVMVAEFSWAYTYDDGDNSGNSVSEDSAVQRPYPVSVQGQANCIWDYINDISAIGPKALGVFYWEPAWLPVPGSDRESRQVLWEKYGSGWASSYASIYDPDDAGVYYGGSAWDNQALFDFNGKALASLATWGLAGVGAEAPVRPDVAEEVEVRVRLGEKLVLPEQVNVLNNDGSKSTLAVKWNVTTDNGVPVEEIPLRGVAEYKVRGVADTAPVLARVAAIELNYVENPSFEEADVSMWNIENLSNVDELFVMDKQTDAKTGTKALHYYSESPMHFKVSQTVRSLAPGKYKASMVLHGGDAGKREDQKIFLFAISGGKEYRQKTFTDGWRAFFTPDIQDIVVGADGIVTIGVEAELPAKAWGSFDDFILTPQK